MTDEYKDFSKQDLRDRLDSLTSEYVDLARQIKNILAERRTILEELEQRG